MLAPVVSSILFILVFGLSLGSRIKEVSGFHYDVFIVPGLIAMAMAQAAYSNNSSSIFQARSDRYIDDVLAAPMHPWQMNLGLAIGGAFRALLIGAALTALAIPLTGAPVEEPLALFAAIVLLVALFGALGIVVGIYAETFDHHTFVNNIVILPLTFVGGVFYSVELLPSPWEEISHANPIFYLVNAVRYGFLGTSDVPRRALLRGHGGDHARRRRLVAVPVFHGAKAQAVAEVGLGRERARAGFRSNDPALGALYGALSRIASRILRPDELGLTPPYPAHVPRPPSIPRLRG